MLPIVISLVLFAAVAASIILYGHRLYVRPAKSIEQLSAPISGLVPMRTEAVTSHGSFRLHQFLQWVGEKVPQDPLTSSFTRRQLMAAGFRSDAALSIFVAIRVLVAALFLFAGFVATRFTHWHPLLEMGAWAASGVIGYMLVGLALDLAVERYQEIIRSSLPDALDLLIVAVEAGLGLDQALKRVSDDLALTHPEICKEFSLVGLECRTGIKRADALRNMAERTMEPEVRKFVAIMIQTDRFGTSIAESLRAHSEFMRIRRRQIAEEKANKLGVKLTVVVFFFILPAIILVSGGPAFLKIYRELLPALRSLG